MLAERLSKKSTFYNILRLQCSDYDGDRHLGDVPYRLAYYLNHGFELDPRTQKLLKHLDIGYFVSTLDEEQLDNYLTYFLSDFYEGKENYNLKRVLKALKKHYKKPTSNTLDILKQVAESNSSFAAIRILNRAFYDSTMGDSLQNISGELTYAMLLDVNQWVSAVQVRQALKTLRKGRHSVQL